MPLQNERLIEEGTQHDLICRDQVMKVSIALITITSFFEKNAAGFLITIDLFIEINQKN